MKYYPVVNNDIVVEILNSKEDYIVVTEYTEFLINECAHDILIKCTGDVEMQDIIEETSKLYEIDDKTFRNDAIEVLRDLWVLDIIKWKERSYFNDVVSSDKYKLITKDTLGMKLSKYKIIFVDQSELKETDLLIQRLLFEMIHQKNLIVLEDAKLVYVLLPVHTNIIKVIAIFSKEVIYDKPRIALDDIHVVLQQYDQTMGTNVIMNDQWLIIINTKDPSFFEKYRSMYEIIKEEEISYTIVYSYEKYC